MGFKDFMHTEKGKLTTGIVAAVLITTAVIAPVSVFADRAIRGNESDDGANSVQVWGYDSQVSSTAEKMDDYMEITKVWANNIYGGQQVLSAEPTLLANDAYHTVNDDIEILDGVASENETLGYLSTSWINSKDQHFDTLLTYDKDNATVAENDVTGYLDPMGDDVAKQAYVNNTGLSATLNIHMKVPVYIADSITINATGPIVDAASSTEAEEYFNNLASKGYADDFAMQLGFFNYIVTDTSNDIEADSVVLPGTEVSGQQEFDQTSWDAMETVYTEIGGTGTLVDAVEDQQNSTSLYSIKIDGTGTNTGLIQAEVERFQDDINTEVADFNNGLDLYYDLVNGGSGEGWKVATADEGDASSDARQDSFLGTQSRFSKDSDSEITNDFWGYDYATYEKTNDGTKYLDPTTRGAGSVIGYTTGIDLPAFFINEGMTFEFQLKTEAAAIALSNGEAVETIEESHAISGFKIGGTEYSYGQTIKVHPIGLSNEGARQIYELGASWPQILDSGLMIGEIVS